MNKMPMDMEDSDDSDSWYGRTWEIEHFPMFFNASIMNLTGEEGNLTARLAHLENNHNIIHNTLVQVVICSLYMIIVIFGVGGNGLVVSIVTRNKAMHTVTNFFIASLAVNDIIICALTVPLTPLYTFLEGWYFGSFMCHLFPLIQAASVYISTLTLTAIAVERFCVICFPYLPKLTTKSACLIIASIWFLSLSICTPYAIFMNFAVATPDGMGPRCDEDWPSYARRTFGTVSLIVQYSIPLVVITCSYVSIWVKLRAQASKGLTSSQRGKEPSAIMRKRRTNRMLVAMVIIFGCCWLPLNLVNILNDYFPQTITGWEYFVLVFFLSHVVAVSSTCYNPILYAWMNENFRKEFKALLPCFSTSRRNNSNRLRRQNSTVVDEMTKYPCKPNGQRNGCVTSTYGEAESTYLPSASPKSSQKKHKAPSNGSAAPGTDENGRLMTAHLLTVPGCVSLQVRDHQQMPGNIYDV